MAAAKIEGEAFKFVLVRKECFDSAVYSLVFFHSQSAWQVLILP